MPHREVRRVPADWQHPRNPAHDPQDVFSGGEFTPLFDGLNKAVREWDEQKEHWDQGMIRSYEGDHGKGPLPDKWEPIPEADKASGCEEWYGPRPKSEDCMPDWPAEQRTHYQMYESTSEGSPISPVMANPESLARWLAGQRETLAGIKEGSYEDWMEVITTGRGTEMGLSGHSVSTLFPGSEPDQPESGPVL